MAANWSKITLLDSWTIQRDENGYTISAQAYAESMSVFPTRHDPVPSSGPSAVPSQFTKYRFSEVVIHPLTSVGPWVADLTAKAHLTDHSTHKDSPLYQSKVMGGYMDFFVTYEHCGYKDQEDYENHGHASRRSNSPFNSLPDRKFANQNWKFLAVTVNFNKREGQGLEEWAAFSGIIPVKSMPSWIKIPHGEDRWRLWDEQLEYTRGDDGSRLLKVHRVLLGIPGFFKNIHGERVPWSQENLGPKDWGDLI